MQDLANFIGGEWKPAGDGATDEVADPATGEVIATAPASGTADVDEAVEAAGAAFAEWSAKTPATALARSSTRVADAIEANMDELRAIECQNVGKPVSIIEFEMDLTLDNWRFFASRRTVPGGQGRRRVRGRLHLHGPPRPARRRSPRSRRGTTRSTWRPGSSARRWSTGNTVVLKPSELTPLTALKLAEITEDILPPGVLNVVCGQGATAGAALVGHPDVAMASLTGSVAAGQAVATAAAATLKRVHLELGRQGPGDRLRRRRRRGGRSPT